MILVVAPETSASTAVIDRLATVHDVILARDHSTALTLFAASSPELVLLYASPYERSALQLCREFRAIAAPRQVQLLVAYPPAGVIQPHEPVAAVADDCFPAPHDPIDLLSRVALHLRVLDSEAHAGTLEGDLRRQLREEQQLADEEARSVVGLQDLAVFTLAKVAESRDNETGHHVLRLREYAQRIATELACNSPYADDISDEFLADLYRSSPLHDIGKVGIPDEILLKPGPLTFEERELMKRHTTIGANILHQAIVHWRDGGFLALAASIARFHHERWDGSGYPAGLVGTEIPIANRIVAVADVYDALTSIRPYKAAWPSEVARQSILDESGKQFDPVVVEAFDRVFPEILEIQRQQADVAQIAVGAMAFQQDSLISPW